MDCENKDGLNSRAGTSADTPPSITTSRSGTPRRSRRQQQWVERLYDSSSSPHSVIQNFNDRDTQAAHEQLQQESSSSMMPKQSRKIRTKTKLSTVELAQTKATDARKLIRKKQNRDSARRCRLKRKMQTADIFDLLYEQQALISSLQHRVEQLHHVMAPNQGSTITCSQDDDILQSSSSEDQSISKSQQAQNPRNVSVEDVTNTIPSTRVKDETPSSSDPTLISSGGQQNMPLKGTQNDGLALAESLVASKANLSMVQNDLENTNNSAYMSGVTSSTETDDMKRPGQVKEEPESILQFDGLHLPDLQFFD